MPKLDRDRYIALIAALGCGKGNGMRYWLDKDEEKTRLIVVTDEAVYEQAMSTAEADRHVGELNAGKSPASVFGKDANHIVLRTLAKVQQEQADDDIDFSYREGKEDKTQSVTILDAGIRAEVLAAVERALHGRFRRYEDQYSKPRSAFAPLVMLTVVGFGTRILANAAAALGDAGAREVDGRNKGLKKLVLWALDLLGPTGITVIGTLFFALSLWYLVLRIRTPPLMHILQAEPYKPQGVAMTAIKYIVLVIAWVVMSPSLWR